MTPVNLYSSSSKAISLGLSVPKRNHVSAILIPPQANNIMQTISSAYASFRLDFLLLVIMTTLCAVGFLGVLAGGLLSSEEHDLEISVALGC